MSADLQVGLILKYAEVTEVSEASVSTMAYHTVHKQHDQDTNLSQSQCFLLTLVACVTMNTIQGWCALAGGNQEGQHSLHLSLGCCTHVQQSLAQDQAAVHAGKCAALFHLQRTALPFCWCPCALQKKM